MKYNTRQPQIVNNRSVIFMGKCVSCNRNTYGYVDDPNPDPRGAIDPYHCAYALIARDYDMIGDDVAMCYACTDTQQTYKKGLEIAKSLWKSEEEVYQLNRRKDLSI